MSGAELIYYAVERLPLNVPDGPRAYAVHVFASEDVAARWVGLVPDGRRLASGRDPLVKWARWHDNLIEHEG